MISLYRSSSIEDAEVRFFVLKDKLPAILTILKDVSNNCSFS